MSYVFDLRKQFSGKTAIVTGGTQGVGEAVARMFAERGAAAVTICGRNKENGKRIATELEGSGTESLFVCVDLGDLEDVKSVVPTTIDRFGGVDILINCAAVTDRGSIVTTTPELFEETMNVNLRAPFFLMQDAADSMKQRGNGGSIVSILSVNAYGGAPQLAPYSASKGGLMTLTRNAANALSFEQIRVHGIALGWTDTPNEDRIQKKYHGATDLWQKEAVTRLPFGRMVQVGDVARTVGFLCSDESGIATGTVFDLNFAVQGTHAPMSDRIADMDA